MTFREASMKFHRKQRLRGYHASNPAKIPLRGWGDIAKRVFFAIGQDDLQVMAAGIAFYFFLAVFPLLAVTISIYGLVVTPAGAEQQIAELGTILPSQSQEVVTDIAKNVASKSSTTLGWGIVLSSLLSLWSANKGTKALVRGLNIAYGQRERRNFFAMTALTLTLTLGILIAGILLLSLVAGVPAVLNFYGLGLFFDSLVGYGRWPVMMVVITLIFAALYRWAPNRVSARWEWVTPGSLAASILWLLGSAGFSYYVDNFSAMGETYGSFAAVVTLMLWFFLTAFVILVGAEINSECEHQTAEDTTIGEEEPMGERGAFYADQVVDGETLEKDYAPEEGEALNEPVEAPPASDGASGESQLD